MFVQIALLVLFTLILVKVLSGSGTHAINAWKKLGISLLTVVMVVSVLFPDVTNMTANFVGIGRGADLLLYVFFAAFLTYVLMQYLRQQDSVDRMNRLARRIAIDEAKKRYDID